MIGQGMHGFAGNREIKVEDIKQAEEAYIELSELYNWNRVECVKGNEIRTVEDINKEILELVKDI